MKQRAGQRSGKPEATGRSTGLLLELWPCRLERASLEKGTAEDLGGCVLRGNHNHQDPGEDAWGRRAGRAQKAKQRESTTKCGVLKGLGWGEGWAKERQEKGWAGAAFAAWKEVRERDGVGSQMLREPRLVTRSSTVTGIRVDGGQGKAGPNRLFLGSWRWRKGERVGF